MYSHCYQLSIRYSCTTYMPTSLPNKLITMTQLYMCPYTFPTINKYASIIQQILEHNTFIHLHICIHVVLKLPSKIINYTNPI